MKVIIIVIAAIFISAGANAQPDQKQPNATDTIVYQTSNNKHPDGYMMTNGRMMCVKDHKMTLLKNDTTLTNGTIVMSNGNFMRMGGTKTKFKEGQHMDLKGKMVQMSGSKDQGNKLEGNKKMYLVKDTIKNKNNQK